MGDSHINKRCLQTEQSLLFYGIHSNGRRYEKMQIEMLFLSGNIALYELGVFICTASSTKNGHGIVKI